MKKIPEGYKETELGVIPQEWEVKELEKCGFIFGGFAFKSSQFLTENIENTLQVIRMGNVQHGNLDINRSPVFITTDLLKDKEKKYLLKKGDVLISLTGTVNKTDYGNISWVDLTDKYLLNQRVGCFRSNLTGRFYYYLLQSRKFREYFFQIGVGGTGNQTNVSLSDLGAIKTISPTLPEQQKIAEILSSVDDHIEKLDETISEYELLKKGMMKKLLTEGIGHTEFKDTELGRIPKDWEVKKLGECVDFYNGKAHESEVDFDGKYILVNSKFVSTEGKVKKYTNLELFPLRKDDITMVMSDVPNGKAIAKTFLIDENNKYTLNQRICCLRAIKDIEPRFLNNVVNRNKYYLRFDDGAKQTNLRKNEVLDLLVQLPSLEEQRLISDILDSLNYRIQLYKSEKNDFVQVKKGLMEKLLTGKIRV